jgi:hypothetical protein
MWFEDSLYPKMNTKQGGIIEYDYTKLITLSGMLNTSYKNDSSVSVRFADSIRNIDDMIMDYVETERDDRVLLYMDCPVDNILAVEDVVSAVDAIVNYNLYNIIPILIPCIEYCAVVEFGDKEKEDYNIVKDMELYRHTKTCQANVSKKNVSFERYCKAVFSKIVPQKYGGSTDVDEFDKVISLEECWRLVHRLPSYYISEYDILKIAPANPHDASRKQLEILISQCERYSEYNIRINYFNKLKENFDELEEIWQMK